MGSAQHVPMCVCECTSVLMLTWVQGGHFREICSEGRLGHTVNGLNQPSQRFFYFKF